MRTRLNSGTISRARQLRESVTDMERKLWSRLRDFRKHGFHFRRQVPFRGYYLDFAEHRTRLVIELDGSQHGADAQHARDVVRDRVLAAEGYRVLRFQNWELVQDFERVVSDILHEAEKPSPPPGALRTPTSPPGGG